MASPTAPVQVSTADGRTDRVPKGGEPRALADTRASDPVVRIADLGSPRGASRVPSVSLSRERIEVPRDHEAALPRSRSGGQSREVTAFFRSGQVP